MSLKATIINSIGLHFTDVQVHESDDNTLKFHIKMLDGPDIAHLSFMMDKHPRMQGIQVRRSGTGLTITINF